MLDHRMYDSNDLLMTALVFKPNYIQSDVLKKVKTFYMVTKMHLV